LYNKNKIYEKDNIVMIALELIFSQCAGCFKKETTINIIKPVMLKELNLTSLKKRKPTTTIKRNDRLKKNENIL
jgi:hypothetical protein